MPPCPHAESPMRTTAALAALLLLASAARADDLPVVKKVELQPLAAQVKRVSDALLLSGSPLSDAEKKAIDEARANKDVAALQAVLDKRCLVGVTIRSGDRGPVVEAKAGPAPAELAEQGWRVFLVKVINEAGVEDRRLAVSSPNAAPMTRQSRGKPDPKVVSVGEVNKRFLDLFMRDTQPLNANLSGLEVEYRILSIYCRDSGRKEASITFGLAKGE